MVHNRPRSRFLVFFGAGPHPKSWSIVGSPPSGTGSLHRVYSATPATPADYARDNSVIDPPHPHPAPQDKYHDRNHRTRAYSGTLARAAALHAIVFTVHNCPLVSQRREGARNVQKTSAKRRTKYRRRVLTLEAALFGQNIFRMTGILN